MIEANYISKDQHTADQATIYWFEITKSTHPLIDEEKYGVRNCNGKITYVNCDGCPVTPEEEQALEYAGNFIITQEMINND